MNGNGSIDAQVLCWPRKVLSADDLRRHLTSQRELQLLPRAIVTPLAADELKARGVRVTWQTPLPQAKRDAIGQWGYGLERPDPTVEAALRAAASDGIALVPLELAPGAWARAVAEAAARCVGGIVFCGDPALLCCIANKHSGLRAATVGSVAETARARQGFGANLFAVGTPGRTFFELRQIVRTACGNGPPCCPPELAQALKELDGHAHR